ncbi:MAG TPA: CHAT domain-containing protein, partial [Thermoleophilaceae bacterium]|nr:CHAT domain-containing protein [Thermoleophilaceae bacterium]
MIEYRTLNVRVEALHEHTYEVIVQGPGGDGRAHFEVPADMPDLDAVASAVSRPRAARRRIETDESALAREFGRRLFDLVFQGTARDVMRMSLSEARSEDHGLRLMLELEGAPKLRNVPWELLWDRPKFVSTSAYTPVVRYVDLPVRPRPLQVEPPLRVLGMVSSPGDVRSLDTGAEREHLTRACGELDRENLLEIDWVEEATLRGLLERLNSGRYHVFHFVGHGDFDEASDDGVLLFEGAAGRSHRVTGTELGTILSDHHTLRLAVINACEGARVADEWGGIAGSLMQYGLPAVIAMQFEISDDAALSFARCFYTSVARSHPVDEALADARRGMFADGYGLEWATPVMFTSVSDCRLFDVRWEKVRAAGSRLALTLELDSASVPGEVTWRLGLENDGELELRELQPLARDGSPLSEPFALASGEQRTLSWVAPFEADSDAVVTVAGIDEEGRIVSERATAAVKLSESGAFVKPAPQVVRERESGEHASVAPPAPPDSEAAPATEPPAEGSPAAGRPLPEP